MHDKLTFDEISELPRQDKIQLVHDAAEDLRSRMNSMGGRVTGPMEPAVFREMRIRGWNRSKAENTWTLAEVELVIADMIAEGARPVVFPDGIATTGADFWLSSYLSEVPALKLALQLNSPGPESAKALLAFMTGQPIDLSPAPEFQEVDIVEEGAPNSERRVLSTMQRLAVSQWTMSALLTVRKILGVFDDIDRNRVMQYAVRLTIAVGPQTISLDLENSYLRRAIHSVLEAREQKLVKELRELGVEPD